MSAHGRIVYASDSAYSSPPLESQTHAHSSLSIETGSKAITGPSTKLTNAAHGLVFLTAISLALAQYAGTLFSWHPVLMSLGSLGLMSEGVLAALKFRPLEGQARVRAIQVHALLQIVATLCIAGGFYAIAQHKNNLGKQHFKSIHAKMGLLTLILSVCAPLGGALSFKYLGLLTKIPERLQPTVKLAHRNLGIATLTVALITIEIILPHHAVWQGLRSRLWQVGVAGIGIVVWTLWLQRVPSKPAAPLGAPADALDKTL